MRVRSAKRFRRQTDNYTPFGAGFGTGVGTNTTEAAATPMQPEHFALLLCITEYVARQFKKVALGELLLFAGAPLVVSVLWGLCALRALGWGRPGLLWAVRALPRPTQGRAA